MSPIAIVLIIMGISVVAFAAVSVVGYFNSGARQQSQIAATKSRQLSEAEKALRSIANGAGNPVLEAQLALDHIESLRTKELN